MDNTNNFRVRCHLIPIDSKIWVYIKKHDLQNPKNKRNILADEKLKAAEEEKKQLVKHLKENPDAIDKKLQELGIKEV